MAAMMRSRQYGNPCRVEGHGSRCEVSHERPLVHRAWEKRAWRTAELGRGTTGQARTANRWSVG